MPESVVSARKAGIRVVLITGDYLKTAAAIAENVEILQPQDNDEEAACDCAKLRPGGNYLANHEMDVFT